MKENTDSKRFLGVVLIIIGSLVFILNYERQTIDLATLQPGQEIIDYYAPDWDPWPPHVNIRGENNGILRLTYSIAGKQKLTRSFTLNMREEKDDRYLSRGDDSCCD